MVREQVDLRSATHKDPPAPTMSTLGGLLRTARPRQWSKNVLVFAAPAAAGVLGQADQLAKTLIALVCFCFAASGTYFLNDAADIDSDRRHPTKQHRPVAAGVISVRGARVVGVILVLAGIGLGFAATWQLALTVASYVALTTLYSTVLKHVPIVDIVAV